MSNRWSHSATLVLLTVPPLVGLFLLGGVLGRLLYETLFPALGLGQSQLLSWLTAVFMCLGWLVILKRYKSQLSWRHSLPFWPLWLNGWYLWQPATRVELLAGWFVLLLSLYTAGLLTVLLRERPSGWIAQLAWVVLPLAVIYWFTLGRTVGAADTFEFQVVVPQLGIVHPTGYPLYLLLGKLWTTLIPVGSVAWRLNLATAVYGLLTAATLYLLTSRLLHRQFSAANSLATTTALVATFALALSPTFWSQAIEAEVYTLHNFLVALVLLITVGTIQNEERVAANHFVLLAFLLGLGLTNHLTTAILFPAVGLAFLFGLRHNWLGWSGLFKQLGKMVLAFALPLLLYAYLPLRWQAVNNEPMGLERFLGWITGSQFQGALQLRAWLADPTRYEVVGRLFLNEWGWWGITLALVGLLFLLRRDWRVALMLAVTWLGYAFYCLNYYVPDLNVFLLPAHLVTAVFLATGTAGIIQIIPASGEKAVMTGLLPLLLLLPLGADVVQMWPTVDQSQDRDLVQWATAVLDLPLEQNALILADSEKIAPLYYLQRAEGVRPDLDIRVLPDEAAYRAALTAALDGGQGEQTVYLARFVPGLEGAYHLRSRGPLTEVSPVPQTRLPDTAVPLSQRFGPLQLVGYEVVPDADEAAFHTAVTLYWQATQPVTAPLKIYLRWADDAPLDVTGQHPAHDYYPVINWKGDEIVTDYHLLPHPYPRPETAELQVAFAPPFTAPDALDWQTVSRVDLSEIDGHPTYDTAVRQWFGDDVWVSSAAWPAQMRPLAEGQALPVRLGGQEVAALEVNGEVQDDTDDTDDTIVTVDVARAGHTAVCGWSLNPLVAPAATCALGKIVLSGVPLPAGATNFGDQIALLDVQPDTTTLAPGGQLNIGLAWQALGPIDDDYTVFVQLLSPAGELVTQVDAWPLQGTYPTSAWQLGETITDPYQLSLPPDLAPGEYQLIIGLYRLADLQRLPVLGADGGPLDDKHTLPGLIVPE
jgi:hypothetical protein